MAADYFAATQQADGARACSLVTPATRAFDALFDRASLLASGNDSPGSCEHLDSQTIDPGLFVFTILGSSIHGDRAEVTGKLDGRTTSLKLERSGEAWLVSSDTGDPTAAIEPASVACIQSWENSSNPEASALTDPGLTGGSVVYGLMTGTGVPEAGKTGCSFLVDGADQVVSFTSDSASDPTGWQSYALPGSNTHPYVNVMVAADGALVPLAQLVDEPPGQVPQAVTAPAGAAQSSGTGSTTTSTQPLRTGGFASNIEPPASRNSPAQSASAAASACPYSSPLVILTSLRGLACADAIKVIEGDIANADGVYTRPTNVQGYQCVQVGATNGARQVHCHAPSSAIAFKIVEGD